MAGTNLGKQVADIYQQIAIELQGQEETQAEQISRILREYQASGRQEELQKALKEIKSRYHQGRIPDDLCYVSGKYMKQYLHDVVICQQFARMNREHIARVLLEFTGLTAGEAFHTIHNYIDVDEMILRKGAIAAHKGEKVLIPVNMRDGSILAIGKGNPEWNCSAPHGAGRIMSRMEARKQLSMEEYRKEMAGIYTTSVNKGTLDEAPMAYKSLDDILAVIGDTADVLEVMKPVYNFKAS